MEKTDKPAWVKNFEDPYSSPVLPGYWNKSANGKAPEQNGGYKMANGGRGGHSETSSLYSRYTSTSSDRSDRKRSNRIGLCIVLTIIALIIAALIGLLVYFLLMADRPSHQGVSGIDGSVRVLNMTYHDDMANTSSQAFRDVAEPFCAELDSYIANSNYSNRYERCEVIGLRNVADVTDCLCLGAKKGSVMVNFQLHFNGSHEDSVLKKDIYDVIESSVTKARFDDVIYVLLKYFLVDIRFDWHMPYDAIEADVTLPVYNLNYSLALTNNRSKEFVDLATPFCHDVDGILMNKDDSWLAPRYTSCRVIRFARQSENMGTVSFTLLFAGHEPRPLQQGLLYILFKGARDVIWVGQRLKMIGSLLITPFGADNRLRPVNETEPEQNITYVSVTLPVFNLTLIPELGDPKSPLFINITTEFCNDLAKFYALSSLKDRYFSCKVLGFRPKQPRIEFQLGFKGDNWPGLRDSVVVVIRAHAPDRIYAIWHLYRVGPLEVILDQIAANGLELHTSLRVVNFTYISALADPGNPAFLHHAVRFCKDLETFYKKSSFANRFLQCGLKAFTPRPVRVHFFLVFKGTSLDGLTSSHIEVIRHYAEQVFFNVGWLAHRVGDLLVLPELRGHSVYPTNITTTHTPTPVPPTSSSDVIPTSTITGDITKAIITGHLYNFTFIADLLDPNSPWFQFLERRFCDDVNRVYLNSYRFHTYRGCRIEHFSPSPDEITFSLYFDAKVSQDLEWGITYVLIHDSPKVNLTSDGLHLVEVLHLGDLFLTLRYITLEPTPSTSFPMPSTSDISPTTLTTMMSSTVTPTTTTTGPDIVTSTVIPPRGTNVTLRYPLLNFTYPIGLGDPTSEVFERYQRLLCLEIQEVFKASRNFYLLYDGCGINKFGFGENGFPYVDFHLLFNTGFTDLLLRTTVETLENSRLHGYATINMTRVFEYLPIGGLLLILENSTASSTLVTSSMTMTSSVVTATPDISSTVIGGGVLIILYYQTYGLGYTEDLKDNNSPRFLAYRQKVCSDLERWYSSLNSPFYLTYHGCDLVSFSSNPEGVTFTLTLRTDMKNDIGRHVRTFLEYVAPKHYVPGFNLLKVGDLYLIVDRYAIDVTPIPTPTHSYTVFTSQPPTSSEISMTMTSSEIQPTPTSSVMPTSSTDFAIKAAVSLKFGLADFFFTDDLNYDFSPSYITLQRDFCADIEKFYKSSALSPFYRSCQIDDFSETPPDRPHKVTFTLLFEIPSSQYLVNRTVDVLLEQEPKIILDGSVTIRVGDLYLILDDWQEVAVPSDGTNLPTLVLSSTYPITPTPTSSPIPESSSSIITPSTPSTTTPDPLYYLRMSFELANFTWHPDLNFPTSPRFQRHNKLFCDELNSFLPGRGDPDFRHYMECNIDNFSGQPMRVNFSLQFDTLQGLNIDRIQRLVISVIKEHAIRHTVGNLMVYRLGDLFIDLDSVYIHNDTSITTVNLFDAIAFKHTYAVSPGNFSSALLDKTSYEFRTRSYEFCKDIDSIFETVGIRNIRERYVGCQVNGFSNGPSPMMTFTVVLKDKAMIDPERLNGIIVFSRKPEGSQFFDIGGLLVSNTNNVNYHYIMLDMLFTHAYPYTTTPVPAVYNYVDVKLRVMSPSWTAEFEDKNSPYYQRMVKGFCDDVSIWMKAEKPNYVGCQVVRISNNPMMIEAQLRFLGQQTGTLDYEVGTILLESPDWDLYGTNIIGFKMGEFVIYEESLDPRVSTTPLTTPSIPSTTPTPTPTRPANPCVLGGVMYRHATLCDRFLHCADGLPIEIPCGQGSVFLDNACKTPTPGFECTPLPG